VPFTPEAAFGVCVFVFREERQANENLSAVKELGEEGELVDHYEDAFEDRVGRSWEGGSRDWYRLVHGNRGECR
jgi:hypothetical protein